jgi:general secretion pathway protein M
VKDWWANLAERERLLVAAAGAVLALALFYLLAWEPLFKARAELEQAVAAQRNTLRWMQEAAVEVRALKRASGPAALQGRNRSLLSVLDQTATQAGIRDHIERMEPEGQNGVKLWLDDVPFDPLVRWMERLERHYGVHVKRASITPADETGRVDARLTLERP